MSFKQFYIEIVIFPTIIWKGAEENYTKLYTPMHVFLILCL